MIEIRNAKREDAEFIARGFLTAMWMTEEEIEKMLPLCSRLAEWDDSLYSWHNTLIAMWNGQRAGVLISYDGAGYHESAQKTFAFVRDNGGEDFTQMTEEAKEGEWYLDTLAVFPEFRRKGVATALLKQGIAKGLAKEGIKSVTLYVDPEHPWVVNLYESVGFRPAGEAFIFGQTFKKMEVKS